MTRTREENAADLAYEEKESNEKKVQEVEMKLDGKKYFKVGADASYLAIVAASSEYEARNLFAEGIDKGKVDASWTETDCEELSAKEVSEEWPGEDIITEESVQ